MSLTTIQNFWKNKKVLITGHTGFKGSWMSFLLSYLGSKVIGYSLNQKNRKSFYHSVKLSQIIYKEYIDDLANKKKLSLVLKKTKPDIIIHFASKSLVIDSYKDPLNTIKSNVIGLQNLLDITKKNQNNIRAILVITSDKCYKNSIKKKIFFEKDLLGGDDPYSASKAMQEILCHSYNVSFFQSRLIATARAGNVVGGGDRSLNRLIPDIVSAYESKSNLQIRNKNHSRPWQFILDCLFGYEKLVRKLYLTNFYKKKKNIYSSSWNFGPKKNQSKKVIELINQSNRYMPSRIIYKANQNFNEHENLYLSTSKTQKLLRYSPKYNFKKTIESTFEWYLFQTNKRNIKLKTISQIKEYLKSN